MASLFDYGRSPPRSGRLCQMSVGLQSSVGCCTPTADRVARCLGTAVHTNEVCICDAAIKYFNRIRRKMTMTGRLVNVVKAV